MLGNLRSKPPKSLPDSVHDHLFEEAYRNRKEFGGPYASAFVLTLQYTCNLPAQETYPDEKPHPAQHRYYQELVRSILDTHGSSPTRDFQESIAQNLRYAQSAYICCFEPSHVFAREVALWTDHDFRTTIIDTRKRLIAELIPEKAALAAHGARVSRLRECWQAPLDITGESALDLIRQMGADDWHEVVLTWNWDSGHEALEWITTQPDCDRATAAYAMCLGNLAQVAECTVEGPPTEPGWDFTWNVARRIEAGFYTKAEIEFGVSLRVMDGLGKTLSQARATGRSPWVHPESLLAQGPRKHQPRYTMRDSEVSWHYDHWLANIARPLPAA